MVRIEVYGDVNLVDHEGNEVPFRRGSEGQPGGKDLISLCRCGESMIKPFAMAPTSRMDSLAPKRPSRRRKLFAHCLDQHALGTLTVPLTVKTRCHGPKSSFLASREQSLS